MLINNRAALRGMFYNARGIMNLRKTVQERLGRIKRFYENPTGILINVAGIASSKKQKPSRPLSDWKFPGELYPYLDTIIEAARFRWEQRVGIDDDLLLYCMKWA